ncbi:hypothetical protein BH24CHL4_BH24CHL4_04100 [soil metagenome]
MRPLGEIVEISKARIEPLEHPKTLFNYVGLENIESHTGRVLNHGLTYGKDIKSTKNVFGPGEILFGKLRPNLNKVHLAIEEGICSTDIYVLKPRVDIALGAYVAYFLRSPIVLRFVTGAMAGANLPRIGQDALLAIRIPVPPLDKQERIVKLLDEADALRKLRAEADRRTAELIPALFYEMFGDPVRNEKGWEIRLLSDHLEFLTSGSRGWAKYYSEQGDLFLRIQNVGVDELILSEIAYVQPPATAEAQRTRVKSGDILLSITADLGRTALVPQDFPNAYINQHLALLRVKNIEPGFVSAVLSKPSSLRKWLELNRSGVKSGLSFADIRVFPIIVPPQELQIRFLERAMQASLLRGAQANNENVESLLSRSLFDRAFFDCGDHDSGPCRDEALHFHKNPSAITERAENRRTSGSKDHKFMGICTVNVRIHPQYLFGLSDNRKTIGPAGKPLSGPVDPNGTPFLDPSISSVIRQESERVAAQLRIGEMGVAVEDNRMCFTIEAESPDAAAQKLEPQLNRFTGLLSLRLGAGRRITWEIVDATFDGMKVHMPSLVLRIDAYFYGLREMENVLVETSGNLTALADDERLDQALRYFKVGEELAALIQESDRSQSEAIILAPGCFLQFWKAIVTITGDPSRDRDHQSRYSLIGLPDNYFRDVIKPLNDIRNNFDVSHVTSPDAPLIATKNDAQEARRVAVEAIDAYIRYLMAH